MRTSKKGTPSINQKQIHNRHSLLQLLSRNVVSTSELSAIGNASLGKPSLIASAAESAIANGANATKPVRDPMKKKYLAEQYNMIRQFLLKEHPDVDYAAVTQPSKENFETLLLLFYCHFDPNFQLDKKMFIQVIPTIFAALVVKTSTMQTISAPHCWPYLTDALAFLAEFVIFGSHEEYFDRVHIYNFHLQCFKQKEKDPFISTSDGFAKEKKQLSDAIEKYVINHERPLQNKAHLKEQLEEIIKRKLECREFQVDCKTMETDIAGFKDYLAKASDYIKSNENKEAKLLTAIEI